MTGRSVLKCFEKNFVTVETVLGFPIKGRNIVSKKIGGIYLFMGGGAYEMRTVGALGLRFGFWVVVAVVALRGLKPGLKR